MEKRKKTSEKFAGENFAVCKGTGIGFLVLLTCLIFSVWLQANTVSAAAKNPASIKLNKVSVTLLYGKTCSLKAVSTPAKAAKTEVTWKSSNPEVATVNSKGKVKAVGIGKARITAKTANGLKAVCTVTSKKYQVSGRKVQVGTSNGTRTYYTYRQNEYGTYYAQNGCVTTAVSIAASAYGKKYTPVQIHTGNANQKYSERYALKKMKASASLYGRAALSVATASQILTDMGIQNKAVYTFKANKAVKEIKEHLKSGNPVIVKTNNRMYNGVRLANGHHALVLIGIDEDGYGIFINPVKGAVNYSHSTGRTFKIKIETLVKYHMSSPVGNYKTPYVTSLNAAGGYILVG